MKTTTSISIDESVLEEARKNRLNISRICEAALRDAIGGYTWKDEELFLNWLVHEKEVIEKLMNDTAQAYKYQKQRYDKVMEDINKQQEIVEAMRRSTRVSALIREINEVIKSCHYDFETSWNQTEELRKQLNELQHLADENWFKAQIERVKSFT